MEPSIATINIWLLEVAALLQRSILVAIGWTVYCHDKYLVARGSRSIATLNIMVAIGASVYCHIKCLVARGCLSIATMNTSCYCWTLYCHANYCVATVWRLLQRPLFCWYDVFCNTICLLIYHILQRQIILSIVHIATLCLLQTIIACRTIYDERSI